METSTNDLDEVKWNGWGYTDSQFVVKDETLYFTGNRYSIGGDGNEPMLYFKEWARDTLNVNVLNASVSVQSSLPINYPESLISHDFLNALHSIQITYSIEGDERLKRSHGQTLYEIFTLRTQKILPRIPDIVIWPKNHDEVCNVVKLAVENNVVIIPFGGGTSVSGASSCPTREPRPIIAIDTHHMKKLKWLNKENLTASFEAGITGRCLEELLQSEGFTSGHEPDSYEFSSLGGWVATKASGMKKNTYGNIEDIVVGFRIVTPRGTFERFLDIPRMSCGPDFTHIILGSEGTLGVITEVIIKIRPKPTFRKYNSFLFRNFESGLRCVREVARQRCQPASIRLMDNEQFKFGQALRQSQSSLGSLKESIKRFYLFSIKNFTVDDICVMTLLFEGQLLNEINDQFKKIKKIAESYGGLCAGENNGKVGYNLTFVIAYIRTKAPFEKNSQTNALLAMDGQMRAFNVGRKRHRNRVESAEAVMDLALTYGVVAESFETSVPWDKALTLCNNVKNCVRKYCEELCIEHYLISCRVTQTYDTGCCIYFYLAFNWANKNDPVAIFEKLETLSRQEIMKSGGSLSHHHGIGKLRSKFYIQQVSNFGADLYRVVKQFIDPQNIFGVGNILCNL